MSPLLLAQAPGGDGASQLTVPLLIFGGVVIPNAFVPLSTNNTDVTVSADYLWTDTFMTYVKYATGFKGGGFSPRPAT